MQEERSRRALRQQRATDGPTAPEPPLTRRALREAREAEQRATTPAAPAAPARRVRYRPGGSAPESESQGAPTILTVCTGNICRSPLAEVLLRAPLEPLGVRVRSAGTHALVGHGMPDEARQVARAYGADPEQTNAHRARLLTDAQIEDADLVLTMTAEQRDHAMRTLPRRADRVFPVLEFARLVRALGEEEIRRIADSAGANPKARLASVVEAISSRRGRAAAPGEEDVIDPYRQPFAVYEASAAQLLPALEEVERALTAALRR